MNPDYSALLYRVRDVFIPPRPPKEQACGVVIFCPLDRAGTMAWRQGERWVMPLGEDRCL